MSSSLILIPEVEEILRTILLPNGGGDIWKAETETAASEVEYRSANESFMMISKFAVV